MAEKIEKEELKIFEIKHENGVEPVFTQVLVNKSWENRFTRLLAWVDIPHLKVVLIYGEYVKEISWGTKVFEQGCTTLDYSCEAENSAVLGKHIFEAPQDRIFRNTHLVCL